MSGHVNVKMEGIPTRNGYEMLDEAYVFKGEENSLVMTQSYTHEFQCVYQLEKYPFDTQVTESKRLQEFVSRCFSLIVSV